MFLKTILSANSNISIINGGLIIFLPNEKNVYHSNYNFSKAHFDREYFFNIFV
jgi:F0F1-type ATP synthase assembly protein I